MFVSTFINKNVEQSIQNRIKRMGEYNKKEDKKAKFNILLNYLDIQLEID